jgi:hypothetical protein
MKSNAISVLIFGRDTRLLESRKWVLQGWGYRVLSARYLSAINRLPLQPAVDLLVLCYSLTSKECESAIAHARLRWPEVKTLALVRHSSARYAGPGEPAPGLSQMAKALDAPDPMVSLIGQLVGHAASSACSHTY